MLRFSEDLDFATRELKRKEFGTILEEVRKSLNNEGFSVDISVEERDNLLSAQLLFKDLMKVYKITDKRGIDLMIKIEVYKRAWNLEFRTSVLSLYGYNFSFILLREDCIFSEKILALFNRRRGRDIYDTLFMLKKKFPFNEDILKVNQIKESPVKGVINYFKNIPQKELEFLAEQVKPFLFKEDDIELVLNASLFAEKFLEDYV
ncbi:MAG: nucleotidyl transferase AbiEii/AbiGii toxin family protein [Candidatus Omnitrophica bacterium]|nr:nucleotidyl transferase AbiEii/AbiGii toxin family protein [Candidatus Omnitrophota bacterium]